MKKQTWIIDNYYNCIIDDDKKITLGNYLEDQIIKIKGKQ